MYIYTHIYIIIYIYRVVYILSFKEPLICVMHMYLGDQDPSAPRLCGKKKLYVQEEKSNHIYTDYLIINKNIYIYLIQSYTIQYMYICVFLYTLLYVQIKINQQ